MRPKGLRRRSHNTASPRDDNRARHVVCTASSPLLPSLRLLHPQQAAGGHLAAHYRALAPAAQDNACSYYASCCSCVAPLGLNLMAADDALSF